MKAKSYSVSLFFQHKVKMKGTDLSPICLTINLKGGIQFRRRLKLYSTKDNFEKALSFTGGNEEVKELRKEMNNYVAKAEVILDRLSNPTKEIFTKYFTSETGLSFSNKKTDITFYFNDTIEELKKENRISTSIGYKLARNSLLRFKKRIFFEDIDQRFVKEYGNWITEQGYTRTTAGIYLKYLRALLNKVVKDGMVINKHNPFQNFSTGSRVKSKEVLYPDQIKKLWEYQPVGIREERAKDYFFFSYLMSGLNFKDVCYLKYSNINGDMLSFVRSKTKNTNRKAKEIKVYLHPEAKKIIEKRGNKFLTPETYIFPITNGYKNYADMETARHRNKRVINKMLTNIGKKLEFNVHVCLGIARHSFATTLKLNGTPISFISDALGHSNSIITEHYLKALPDEKYKMLSESLLNFNTIT